MLEESPIGLGKLKRSIQIPTVFSTDTIIRSSLLLKPVLAAAFPQVINDGVEGRAEELNENKEKNKESIGQIGLV